MTHPRAKVGEWCALPSFPGPGRVVDAVHGHTQMGGGEMQRNARLIVVFSLFVGISLGAVDVTYAGFGSAGYPDEMVGENFGENFGEYTRGDGAVWLTNDTDKRITLTKIYNTGCGGNEECRVVNEENWKTLSCLERTSDRSREGECFLEAGEAKWVFYIEEIDDENDFNNAYFHFYIKIGDSSEIEAFTVNYWYGTGGRDDIKDNAHRITAVAGQSYSEDPVSGDKVVDGETYTLAAGRGDYDPNRWYLTFLGVHSQPEDKYTPPDTSNEAQKLNVMTYNIAGCEASFLWLQSKRYEALAEDGMDYFKNIDILVLTEAGIDIPDWWGLKDPVDLVAEDLCCGDDKPFQQRTTILNGMPKKDLTATAMNDTGGVVVLSRSSIVGSDFTGLFVEDDPELNIDQDEFLEGILTWPDEKELHYRYTYENGECPEGVAFRCFSKIWDPITLPFGLDIWPDKGYLKVMYRKTVDGVSQDYYIIASHTTPEERFWDERKNQLDAMWSMARNLPSDIPVIYVGDFNTENDTEIDEMLYLLGVNPVYEDEFEGVSAGSNNFYALLQKGYVDKRLDWILPHENGAIQPELKARVLPMRHPSVPPFDLSDHDALLVELDYDWLRCPEDIVETEGLEVNAAGQCGKTIAYFGEPSSQIADITVSFDPPEGSFFPLGTTQVDCSAFSNENGDTAECSLDVTVEDLGPPTITATDYDVGTDPGVCYATVDNYQLSIEDNCGSDLAPTCVPEAGEQLPLGMTSVACSVSDESGYEAETLFNVSVVDTEPPVIVCPDDVTVNNDFGACGAYVDYEEPVVADNCSVQTIVRTGRESGSFFLVGTTPVTYEVTDTSWQSASCSFDVTVVDTEPPVIESLTAAPDLLWPLNRKMRPVTIEAVASDNCSDPPPQCRIESVASDEPVSGRGYGNRKPDWMIVGDLTVDLRAERGGKGDGRVYTNDVKCTDSYGNSATESTTVIVPHDLSRTGLPTAWTPAKPLPRKRIEK